MLLFNSQEMQLPSAGIPYDVKQITMQPFGVKQIMMLSRAVATGSWAPVVQALDSVLDYNVNLITDGDFYFLLAVQRILGYKISPLQASWDCQGVVFRENEGLKRTFTRKQIRDMVKEYDAASEEERAELANPDDLILTSVHCNHSNAKQLTMSDLFIVPLETKTLPEGLDFPRTNTLVDSLVAKNDPDNSRVVQAARWIAHGDTLEEKMDILANQPDLRLFELALQTDIKVRHGVSQIIALPCERCEQPSEHTFNIGPETFFDV